MSQDDVEVVRKLFDRWAAGELMTPEFFDAEAEYVRVGADFTGGTGVWRGLDQIWVAAVEWARAFDDLRNRAEKFIDLGDRVLVLWRQSGRGRASGIPYEQELADIFTLRNGKIVRLVSYWDRSEALEAAGLSEQSPSETP